MNIANYKHLAALAGLVGILVLSSLNASRYDENKEGDKGLLAFSVIGILFSVVGVAMLGLHVKQPHSRMSFDSELPPPGGFVGKRFTI